MRIHVGDEIEYITKVPVHGVKTDEIKTRKGIVIQITDRFMAVQGERYPETILINDIQTGKVKFAKLVTSDGEEVFDLRNTKYSHIDWPAAAEQAQKIIKEQGLSLYKTAGIIGKEIGVPSATVYYRLKYAGVSDDLNEEGGDIVEGTEKKDQVISDEPLDLPTVFSELQKKWIKDVLYADLPTTAQMTIIERIISLEGVA